MQQRGENLLRRIGGGTDQQACAERENENQPGKNRRGETAD
jgi:hypothetical protein